MSFVLDGVNCFAVGDHGSSPPIGLLHPALQMLSLPTSGMRRIQVICRNIRSFFIERTALPVLYIGNLWIVIKYLSCLLCLKFQAHNVKESEVNIYPVSMRCSYLRGELQNKNSIVKVLSATFLDLAKNQQRQMPRWLQWNLYHSAVILENKITNLNSQKPLKSSVKFGLVRVLNIPVKICRVNLGNGYSKTIPACGKIYNRNRIE